MMSEYSMGMAVLFAVSILYSVWRSWRAPWSEVISATVFIFLMGMVVEMTFSR